LCRHGCSEGCLLTSTAISFRGVLGAMAWMICDAVKRHLLRTDHSTALEGKTHSRHVGVSMIRAQDRLEEA